MAAVSTLTTLSEVRTRVSRKAFVSDTDGRFYYYCFIRDASRSGCRLYSPDCLDFPEYLWLYPETFKAPILGRIAWCKQQMAGIQFIKDLPASLAENGNSKFNPEFTFDEIGVRIVERTAKLRGTQKPASFTEQQKDSAPSRAARDYFATIVHELKTPITSISGVLSLLASQAMSYLPKKFQELVRIASRNTERLQRLVGDLLDSEKIERGKITMRPEKADLNLIAREAAQADGQFAKQHEVTLRVMPLDGPAMVNVDVERMCQVLSNLISNAAKFSNAGQEVMIRLERVGANIRLSVIDSGAGIPAVAQARIFERFEQADEHAPGAETGTGLGLSICKSIIECHKSKIELASEPGRGSAFYFDLPEIASDQGAAGAREGAA